MVVINYYLTYVYMYIRGTSMYYLQVLHASYCNTPSISYLVYIYVSEFLHSVLRFSCIVLNSVKVIRLPGTST